ncbi:MAG TPA: Xaa-Pro peptidase family protein [Fimbriiglobus sp.]|jgi:Xaa-Pro aminopeptidase
MDYASQRRASLLKNLKKDGHDAILVTNPVSVTYLCGFTGDSSFLFVHAKGATLITDDRYAQQAEAECPALELHVRPHSKTTPQAAGEILAKHGAKSCTVEADHCSLALLGAIQTNATKTTFVPVTGQVELLRMLKDASEVEHIRSAVRVAERAFVMFKSMLRESDTEKDMVDALECFVRRAGGKGASFPPIVAVGDRGALPHAQPTSRRLGETSKLLVDFGADIGYKSDITRTFRSPFGTAPTRRNKQERVGYNLEELQAVVVAAQTAAVAAIRPEVPARDVDTAARKVIEKAGYSEYFTHGTGHGIGLEIHELPRIRQNSDDVLDAGMVVTIEPGIYIPGWGGVRIEDDYLVTRDGAVCLTTLPKDVTVLS